jgi:hypothetical protein
MLSGISKTEQVFYRVEQAAYFAHDYDKDDHHAGKRRQERLFLSAGTAQQQVENRDKDAYGGDFEYKIHIHNCLSAPFVR